MLKNFRHKSQVFQRKMLKRSTWLMVCGSLGLFLTGCTKPPAPSAVPPPATTNVAEDADAPASQTASQPEGPKDDEKICFACKGTGQVKCTAPGCVDGVVDCPGPCLKLDQGVWIHMNVPGHPPTDLWRKFSLPGGGYAAYSQNHVGHVIAMEGGQAVDTGACKICGGTGKMPCSVCQGTGQVACPICGGKKFIPVSWSPTNNPWLNSQPDLIRLTDGKIMFGTVQSTIGSDVAIKLRGGKWIHLDVTNIVSKSDSTSTNTAH
jgi:hypothetical protein